MAATLETAEKPKKTRLPGPESRPNADVVIFDGHCRICTGGVELLSRFDWGGRLAYLSLHDQRVAERYPDLTHEQMMEEMYVIDQRGNRRGGAPGFRYLTRRLPLLWPVAPLMHIPFSMYLWSWIYRKIARARYRFGKLDDCENGACKVHFK